MTTLTLATLNNPDPLSSLRFLEFAIPCNNVLDSLQFFRQLGFSEVPTNEIHQYPYAVITDGRCFLGLHDQKHYAQLSTEARFSFVHEDVASVSRILDIQMSSVFADIEYDQFQQALYLSPAKAGLHIIAARSFSPPPAEDCKDSTLGRFRGIVLPTRQLQKSVSFWEEVGLLVMPNDDQNCVMVSANRLNLLLLDTPDFSKPAFLFEHPNPENLFPHLARYGLTVEVPEQGLPFTSEYLLKGPNGMQLLIKKDV